MPSLKQYRTRIASVKSTQKITSAMKMVAAAKLRRAQEKAEAARPYAERMSRMLGSLAGSLSGGAGAPALLAGTGRSEVHLVVVATSDRGLCGAFNSSIVRGARNLDAAKKFYDWALTPSAQALGAATLQFQLPSHKDAKVDPRVPDFRRIKLINYDYAKYGQTAERRRLIQRWEKEVNSLPR